MIEVLAESGFDFVIIDQEHAAKGVETIENMIRAANVYDLPALVRVASNEEKAILAVIESGAAGIVVPFIESRDDVDRASRALFFPPKGNRGVCTQTRAARHGALRSRFLDHVTRENDRLVLMGLIESLPGARNIGEILTHPAGLDALMVGRSDLAAQLGKPGQAKDPEVMKATVDVLSACTAGDFPETRTAMVIYQPEEVDTWKRHGSTIFIGASEVGLILDGLSTWRGATRDRSSPEDRSSS